MAKPKNAKPDSATSNDATSNVATSNDATSSHGIKAGELTAPAGQTAADEPRPPWWADEALRRDRLRDQVKLIVDALGGPAQVGVMGQRPDEELGAGDYGDMVYMFRRGRILTRSADAARVSERVGGAIVEGGIAGLDAVSVADVQAALRLADAAFGVGVAYPDHVLYVTPTGSACPATEPVPPRRPRRHPVRRATRSSDGRGVFVAVVDTGFDAKTAAATPWLAGVTGEQEDIDPANLIPYNGHGTIAAGLIRTMAPRTQVYVHAFLPHGGAIFESDIIVQLREAILQAPDIISMSAGSHSRADAGLLSFRVLWEHLRPKGTVLVAAAGNDGDRKPFFPAADDYAIGVGAMDRRGRRAKYSNYGSWVDVYAVGDVVNAFPNGSYTYVEPPTGQTATFTQWMARWAGTSFATPIVAGVIAARMTASGESGQQAARSLLKTARKHARIGVGPVVEPWMADQR